MEFSLVAEGSLSRGMLESKDGKNFSWASCEHWYPDMSNVSKFSNWS